MSTKQFAISQSINGISLNGQEFALCEKGKVKMFGSAIQARCFALSAGATGEDFDAGRLNVCKFDADGNYEVC